MKQCKYCGALHAPDTAYGDGCPFAPETWPIELQREQQDDWPNWPSQPGAVDHDPT